MDKYFRNINTLEDLRKQYKELLKTEGSRTADNSKADNAKYDFEADEKLREVLSHIIVFSGINIDIVGSWIWVDGNTYPYKNELKALGFRWSKQRKKWHWHDGDYRRFGSKKLSYEDIQNMYGSTEIKAQQRELLQA